MKLFVLEGWIKTNLKEGGLDFSQDNKETYTLWDHIFTNEINIALKQAHDDYSEMKFKNIIVLFNHLLNIKESYMIAKGGEKNDFVVARYVEAVLTIMNPIVPHFAQHVWSTIMLPTLKASTNSPKEFNDNLLTNGWPESGEVIPLLTTQLKYLESNKREIRLALDKAMSGGKKKGKGGKKGAAPAEPEAPKEKCLIAIGSTYPEF